MRNAIRAALMTALPEVGDRVLEPHAGGPAIEKPFVVVRIGTDSKASEWAGWSRQVEVWIYRQQDSYVNIDDMEERVRAALHMVRLTTDAGEHFTCVLTAGRGIDFFDDEWAAIGRGQAFAILAIQPVSISETVEDDTWITALADYTTAVLGTGWHIYKNAWPQDYTAPAILWHITTVGPITQVTSGLFRVVKHIQGHYVGRTPNEQLAAMVTMVERFGRDIKITLDATNRRFLTVAAPTIDQRVDALRAGQMAIQLSRLTQRPTEDVPKMRIVHVGGKLN